MSERVAALFHLQRTVGNRQVGRLLDAATLARQPSSSTRPSRSELYTIATTAINGEYAGAARDGLSDFEAIVGNKFDAGSFVTALAGNVLWAAACFASGGAAFGVSLAGIGLGAAAPGTSSSMDMTGFHMAAGKIIDDLVVLLIGKIDRMVGNADVYATEHQFDDHATRDLLLGQIFDAEYIQHIKGGPPTVGRAAIRHRVARDLVIKANTQGGWFRGPGRFIYEYGVDDYKSGHDYLLFSTRHLEPISDWTFDRSRTSAFVPQGGSDAVKALANQPMVQPASIQWEKSVYLYGEDGDRLDILLDANNAIDTVYVHGLFDELGQAPKRPRGFPVAPDREGAAAKVLASVWKSTQGLPPPIPGRELLPSGSPGRSTATR